MRGMINIVWQRWQDQWASKSCLHVLERMLWKGAPWGQAILTICKSAARHPTNAIRIRRDMALHWKPKLRRMECLIPDREHSLRRVSQADWSYDKCRMSSLVNLKPSLTTELSQIYEGGLQKPVKQIRNWSRKFQIALLVFKSCPPHWSKECFIMNLTLFQSSIFTKSSSAKLANKTIQETSLNECCYLTRVLWSRRICKGQMLTRLCMVSLILSCPVLPHSPSMDWT